MNFCTGVNIDADWWTPYAAHALSSFLNGTIWLMLAIIGLKGFPILVWQLVSDGSQMFWSFSVRFAASSEFSMVINLHVLAPMPEGSLL